MQSNLSFNKTLHETYFAAKIIQKREVGRPPFFNKKGLNKVKAKDQRRWQHINFNKVLVELLLDMQ